MELKGIKHSESFLPHLLFLIHRVELKVDGTPLITKCALGVSNSPCGVESLSGDL